MSFIRYLAVAVLAIVTPAMLAQSPFQVSGLHTDLVFADAKAMTEKLGGKCRIKQSRSQRGGVSAQCEMSSAGDTAKTDGSGQPDAAAHQPSIGAQPITRIGMEAADESAQLTRIVFVFEGSLETVAEYLVQQYGQPTHNGASTTEQSWSHSRRRSWSQGIYSLGLLNSPDLVILTVNRPPPDPGTN